MERIESQIDYLVEHHFNAALAKYLLIVIDVYILFIILKLKIKR